MGKLGVEPPEYRCPAFRPLMSAVRLGPQTEYPEYAASKTRPPSPKMRARWGVAMRPCGEITSAVVSASPQPRSSARISTMLGMRARAAAHTTNHGRNLMLAMKATTPRF